MTKELSKNVITHKLTIKWVWIKYIWKEFAENIFFQLEGKENKKIVIKDKKSLTYIEKYKWEVELIPLDKENKSFEDKIHLTWLNEEQKEKFRNIWKQRKKENKSTWEVSFNEIIQAIKNNRLY